MLRLFASAIEGLTYPLILVFIMWLSFFLNLNYGWNLELYGIRPHVPMGLTGILFMPLLHENFEHLFSNTLPILVAGGFLFYYFKRLTWLILSVIWAGSGIFLWFTGEEGTLHIGASGLVYGLVFFLLVSGLIRGHRQLAAVALLMVFLYGGLLWGLFPEYVRIMNQNISWEGHLGGTLAGILMSLVLYRKGPQKPTPSAETEETETDEYPYWLEIDPDTQENRDIETRETTSENKNAELPSEQPPVIHYRYVPKNANPWEKDDPV